MNEADAVFLTRVRPICLGLPDAYEESAWVGTRWRVRMRTFAHLLAIDGGRPPAYAKAAGTDGPACVLMVSAKSPDLYATARSGWPYFPATWGRDLLGVVLGDRIEWDEVAELVTESYRTLAPRKLAASMIGPVRLRAAQAPDAEAVAAIWHAGWRDGHLGHVPDELLSHRTPESFAARAAQRVADTVVATVGDCVAGFVMVTDDEVEQRSSSTSRPTVG